MGAYDKMSRRAKQVMSFAQEEARAFNHPYIGTEHLLLGLILEGEGVAARVLTELGVTITKARNAVEFIVGHGEGPRQTNEVDLTARAKKVFEYAIDEARKLNHTYISTEHILLGLVRNAEGVATGVLEIMAVSLDQVRTQVMRMMRQGLGGGTAPAASDVYSLAVVAFECLAGRKPFVADTPVATAVAHLRNPVPEPVPDTPGGPGWPEILSNARTLGTRALPVRNSSQLLVKMPPSLLLSL